MVEWLPAKILRSKGSGLSQKWDVNWVHKVDGQWEEVPAEDDPRQTEESLDLSISEIRPFEEEPAEPEPPASAVAEVD